MVFGAFDGIHAGHRAFFNEARHHGDYLMAVVAQNHIIEHLKGHLPEIDLEERFRLLEKEDQVDEVIVGDGEVGAWEVVKRYHPEVIALGYDQREMLQSLNDHMDEFPWHPEVVVTSAFEPDKYHSSILKKKRS